MSNRRRIRAIVEGRVQGVGFRWFVERVAMRLGLVGWVKNDADGSVETIAEGESASIEEFIAELWRGPSSASVFDVKIIEEAPRGEFDSFRIVF